MMLPVCLKRFEYYSQFRDCTKYSYNGIYITPIFKFESDATNDASNYRAIVWESYYFQF